MFSLGLCGISPGRPVFVPHYKNMHSRLNEQVGPPYNGPISWLQKLCLGTLIVSALMYTARSRLRPISVATRVPVNCHHLFVD